jgi:hypothetical protein
MCLATLRPLNFFKRKKEKKESRLSSGGFQKSKFFRKNTTLEKSVQYSVFSIQEKCVWWNGWRFFLKPVGLELAFLNTRNLPLLSFFYLFFFEITYNRLFEIGGELGVVLFIEVFF